VKKAFEIIDHTADIGIAAFGDTFPELFANAALGMFSLMIESGKLTEDKQHKINLSSTDRETLLVDWLNELLFVYYDKYLVCKRFNFDKLSDTNLKATCCCAKINPTKQHILREIKAATHHMLSIDKIDNGYKAQVIFDI
jgi:SHS2 domain-containing protein